MFGFSSLHSLDSLQTALLFKKTFLLFYFVSQKGAELGPGQAQGWSARPPVHSESDRHPFQDGLTDTSGEGLTGSTADFPELKTTKYGTLIQVMELSVF